MNQRGDYDVEVALVALHTSRSAATAQRMVEQAERLVTAAHELLADSEAKLRAAIAKRERGGSCSPTPRRLA